MPAYDLLLKGGVIIDGQRTPRYTSDVAVAGGRIAHIGGIAESEAARVIGKPIPSISTAQGIFYGFHSDESAEAHNAHATKHVVDYQQECGGVLSLDPLRFHLYG